MASDSEMPDAPTDTSEVQDVEEEVEIEDQAADEDYSEPSSSNSDEEEEEATPGPEGGDSPAAEPVKEEGAPADPPKRKRGRPPGSGRKKLAKGGRFQALEIPLDENGKPYAVENDELVLPADPAGEQKIDPQGVLLNGREFRVRTFTVLGRGQRQYMLATEPARCVGFRDSYLLFQRHRKLLKIKLNDDEKLDLISRGLMPHSYKGRTIGVITARSVFREFGARLIVGGHHVIDDYYEAEAIANGKKPDELADPEDALPRKGEEYNRNQYVAWYNEPKQVDAVAMYENNLKSVLKAQTNPGAATDDADSAVDGAVLAGPPPELVAQSQKIASSYNSELAAARKAVLQRASSEQGIVEPHTGVRFTPENSQPQASHFSKLSSHADQGSVVITTVVDWSRAAPNPNLAALDPEVWASADAETKKAIEEEIAREQALEA